MAGSEMNVIRDVLTASRDVLDAALADESFQSTVAAIAAAWTRSLRAGGKIMLCGNGGSAADAQHIAGELISRFLFDRAPLAAIALTVDTSILTAIGNDYGYELVFERQIRGLGRQSDVFIAISTSGKSPNVLAALGAARKLGITTIGFTGTAHGANAMRALSDIVLAAPTYDTPMIQQIHITAAHAICEVVERDLFASKA